MPRMYSPDASSGEGAGVLLGVCPFELVRLCGLGAAGQLIVCSRVWGTLQEFLPKVAEASQKGLLLARADCSQLLRCDALGEWHEEELPEGAPSYLNCAAAFYKGHVFVVGGRSPDLEHCVASAAALHIEKRTWRQLPSLTSARCRAAAVGANGSLVVLGGHAQNTLDLVEELEVSDTAARVCWRARPRLPERLCLELMQRSRMLVAKV